MVRILLAAVTREFPSIIQQAMNNDPDFQFVGLAMGEAEAVQMARHTLPDVVAVELPLGNLHGVEIIRELMIEAPIPVVAVVKGNGGDPGGLALRALEYGAIAVIPAPQLAGERLEEISTRKFLSTLRAMSQVKVVRRWRQRSGLKKPVATGGAQPCRIVAIVASTGGPAALRKILGNIPAEFPAPILIVQHISNGFIKGVAAALDAAVPLKVAIARDNDPLTPGKVYFAPDDRQLGLANKSRVRVCDAPAVNGFRPSGNYLFESMAHVFGSESLAVVLTGMGNDGTEGLRAVWDAQGAIIAQDEASSVVFGMPKAAIDSGFVKFVLPLERIASKINSLTEIRSI